MKKTQETTVDTVIDIEPTKKAAKRPTKKAIEEELAESNARIKAYEEALALQDKPVKASREHKSSKVQLLLILSITLLLLSQQLQINQLRSIVTSISPFALRTMELRDMKYYSENKLSDIKSSVALFQQKEAEYMVYFSRVGCSYCEEAEKNDIMPFIQDEYTNNIKMYFYDMVDGDFLYANAAQQEKGLIRNPS